MKARNINIVSRALMAGGLFVCVAAAQAATGYNVSDHQEAMIHAGMTSAQVNRALGTPDTKLQYPSSSGPTWSYNDPDGVLPGAFHVNFGPNGKVASADEIPIYGH